ncbi:hypothetical protein M409DRAFT_22855 [Zasmidium cellare ATCC 36951]|uniref:REJ domain-containing protein n=1 Tax=Zasmidium cellare ATCC 36951 TaxID=1080233 RepID=A0A6A6CIE5_ZASCE|nr:uncharacterized protein M409DRAFT_22855 [Zasmidium cellare ATCC 36951]KAF2166801.1 hypothetical protein M409DRAFT_22855 [Zasmidium cellare ATCC 36951]
MSSSTSVPPTTSADPSTSSVSSVPPTTESSSTPPPVTSSTSSSIESSSILSSISSAVSSSILSPSSTTTVESSATQPSSTTTISISSQPATTRVFTSVVTTGQTSDGSSASPVTVVVTQTQDATTVPITSAASTSDASSTTSGSPALNTGTKDSKSGGGGLSTAGTTAVAVVVPVVVVALLVLAGIFFWRKRKQRKAAEEARRKEVEDYGFNPNNDPTLPTVASESGQEMSEDHSSGYRGWGAAGASNRKMSTTLSGGHTQGQLSDTGSNPYRGGVSPTGGASDGNSGDALMHNRRETMNSDDVGSLGQAPLASANQPGMKRGPSNASSTYSAAGHSDVSDGAAPPGGMASSYEAYNANNGFGYSQHGPYGDGTYGGGNAPDNGMPVVRDVSARRNTRIQQPGNYQQGNSGIAQNF